jgi:putative transposase
MLENDSNTLRELYRNCKDMKEKIRYTTLYAISRGFSVAEAAKFVDVEESTVYDWVNKWVSERGVSDKPRSGRPASITKEDEEEIRRLLDENDPKKHGINASSYTTVELQEYFIKFHSKHIDEETFRIHLLKTGAKYVKAQLRYKEGDLNKQVEFARNFFTLATTYGFTKILFVDEMSISTSAHNGYGWTYEQRLVVDAPQKDVDRANYFGAVEVSGGEIIETVRADAKTPSFLCLLRKIEKHYPYDKTLVMMDNSTVHHDRRVARFFNKRENMKLLFMPPYSPNINPEEYAHNYLRDKLLNNHNFKSIKQIGFAVSRFVKKMSQEKIRNIATLLPIEMLLSAQEQL